MSVACFFQFNVRATSEDNGTKLCNSVTCFPQNDMFSAWEWQQWTSDHPIVPKQ